MKNILWFKEISKSDIGSVGGKGASLGELFDLVPIPDGFCISAQAYETAISHVKDEVMRNLEIDIEDNDALESSAEKAQSLIKSCTIAEGLHQEIVNAYNKLGGGFVAVRSSATAEDLPGASFAGQQSTFLNVRGEDSLLNAVLECWASLYTPRAIYYREKNGFKHEDVLISVVVQKMVDSDCAGVMFTINPVTNNTSEVLIEGNYGLGESVVSGQVTPDTYILRKEDGKMLQKNIAEKLWGLFRGENGENFRKSMSEPNRQLLSEQVLAGLVELGKKIEGHYKAPQDIEWAIEKGSIYIVQARPVTTFK